MSALRLIRLYIRYNASKRHEAPCFVYNGSAFTFLPEFCVQAVAIKYAHGALIFLSFASSGFAPCSGS